MLLLRQGLILTAAAFLLCGCTHTVEYDLTDQDRAFERKLNKVVEVKNFTDKTPRWKDAVVKIDGENWRSNPKRGYTDANLSYSVSSMFAKHLDFSGLFRDVVYKGSFDESETLPTGAPLVLSGVISEYSVMGKVNQFAETKSTVSKLFGTVGRVAGVIANLDEVTELRVKITLKDVQLKEAATGRVLWRDSITLVRKYPAADFERSGSRTVYDNADDCLKDMIDELIRRLEKRLEQPRAPLKKTTAKKKQT